MSIEIDSDMTQIIQLVDKDIKTAVIIIIYITINYMLKKIKEIMDPTGFSIKIDL